MSSSSQPDSSSGKPTGTPPGQGFRFTQLARYSQWDGSQTLPPLDARRVLSALADDLLDSGDLQQALRRLLQNGLRPPSGQGPAGAPALPGLRHLLAKLRAQRKAQLEHYNLDGIFTDIQQRLDAILDLERSRISAWQAGNTDGDAAPATNTSSETNPDADQFEPEAEPSPFTQDLLRNIAERNAGILDALPKDPAGQIRELEHYEFLHPDAQRQFLELLNQFREALANTFFGDVSAMVQSMSEGDVERMTAMTRALNDLLVQKIAGKQPDFDAFMAEFGDMFGANPPKNLDELLQQMARQMANMQALMAALSPEQRRQLMELMGTQLGNPELERELMRLGKELRFLMPDVHRHQFSGEQGLDLLDAMKLMDQVQGLDQLDQQILDAARSGDLSGINRDELRELLGDQAGDALDQLDELTKLLEDAGLVRNTGDQLELTAQGNRRLAQSALAEIYARLKAAGLGSHSSHRDGQIGEPVDASRPWVFGDPFNLHLARTLRNAVQREGPGTPLRMQPDDFEVHRSERSTRTTTVLLLDLSWSMTLRGAFGAAKKVALALQQLITSQYRSDQLYLVGFSAYAKELKPADLPSLACDEYTLGTNMEHALQIAERLLARHPLGSRQILMISDGEPTSHLEQGQAVFAYPPSDATLYATLKQVRRCTRRGITINSFMLEHSPYLRWFMDQVAKINGGRVFFTSPDQLGEYMLVDYVQHKRRHLRRAG